MPLRSMTGFGRARVQTGRGEWQVTIKAVNHRTLDLRMQLPSSLEELEPEFRAAVAAHAVRGHIDIRFGWTPEPGSSALVLNRPALRAWLRAFEAGIELGFEGKPDLNQALRVPGMLQTAEAEEAPVQAARELLAEALAEFNRFREREGAALQQDMTERACRITHAVGEMVDLRDTALPAFQSRLIDKIGELLRNAGMDPSRIDPQRLAVEASILADRSDIGEEITRLRVHTEHLREILEQGGEIGKKLDFLLQEMNRETNTILAKTNGAGETTLRITSTALSVKAEIEKLREQASNLE